MNTDYKDIFAMAGPLARALPDYAYRPEQALMAKAVGAALARLLPRRRWAEIFPVTPATLFTAAALLAASSDWDGVMLMAVAPARVSLAGAT